MSVACPVFGDKSYLFLATESSFGVTPGSPTYVYHPCFSYGVELSPEQRKPFPYTGMSEDFDTIVSKNQVAGQISFPLYGWRLTGLATSLAEYLLTWAHTDLGTLCGLASKLAEWAEGPDVSNKRHNGLTVNGLTLTGSDDNGGSVLLNLDVMGTKETSVGTAQTIPSTLERLNEFLFSDTTFSIGPDSGSLVEVEIKGFTWQRQRNLTPVFNGSFYPRRFRAGKPANTFEFNIEKADGTWDAIRRATDASNYYGRLTLQGLHNGSGATGDYAKVQIDFPKLAFNLCKDTFARSGPALQAVTFGVQKPSTSTASSTLTWSEV